MINRSYFIEVIFILIGHDKTVIDAFQILVGDCMVTVNKFINEKKKVDYIFGDLTDIPISETACGELWEFMISTLNAAFKILKPDGKFMTHVSCIISSKQK